MRRKEYEMKVATQFRDPEKRIGNDPREVKALRFLEGKSVLDIGCGDGTIAKYIQKTSGAKVTGVDISPGVLNLVKEKGIECYQIDTEDGLPDKWKESFDAVLIAEVLEHVFDTDFVVQQAKKVLKPGGCLVITIPNTARLPYRGLLLFGHSPRFTCEYRATGKEVGHIRAFDAHRIRILLEENGLKIEEITGDVVNFVLFKSKFLADIFPNAANSLIVKARKL